MELIQFNVTSANKSFKTAGLKPSPAWTPQSGAI